MLKKKTSRINKSQFKFESSDKKGVSEIVSYVILIAITISIAVGIFAWLRTLSNVNPPADCKEGTSMIISDYLCESGATGKMTLSLRNNGRFNIDGFVLKVGNNSDNAPTINLKSINLAETITRGYYQFQNGIPLAPGETRNAIFSYIDVNSKKYLDSDIKIIEIQPFVIDKSGIIICKNAVIKEPVDNCKIIDETSEPAG